MPITASYLLACCLTALGGAAREVEQQRRDGCTRCVAALVVILCTGKDVPRAKRSPDHALLYVATAAAFWLEVQGVQGLTVKTALLIPRTTSRALARL